MERQQRQYCGLHALRNLLRVNDITVADMNRAARWCADMSNDVPGNHMDRNGNWSLGALKKVLRDRGYKISRAAVVKRQAVRWNIPSMSECMDEADAVGFIILSRNHFTSLRKMNGAWEYCDSLKDRPYYVAGSVFSTAVLNQECTAFLVQRTI